MPIEGWACGGGKCSIAISQQNRQVITAIVSHDQVQNSISIKIA